MRLLDIATVFTARVLAMKEAISDALKRGSIEKDVYSDSRLTLKALNGLVFWHRTVAEIKDLVKHSREKIFVQ